MGSANPLRQCHPRVFRGVPRGRRLFGTPGVRRQYFSFGMLYHRRHYLLVSVPSLGQSDHLHGRPDVHVLLPDSHRRARLVPFQGISAGGGNLAGHLHSLQYDHHRTGLLSHRRGDTIGKAQVQDDRDRQVRV